MIFLILNIKVKRKATNNMDELLLGLLITFTVVLIVAVVFLILSLIQPYIF